MIGAEGSFPRVKQLRHEADYSPPANAQVKKRKYGSIHPLLKMSLWHNA
jgi:hypothetical protein